MEFTDHISPSDSHLEGEEVASQLVLAMTSVYNGVASIEWNMPSMFRLLFNTFIPAD